MTLLPIIGANETRIDGSARRDTHRLRDIDGGLTASFLVLMLMGLTVLYAARY